MNTALRALFSSLGFSSSSIDRKASRFIAGDASHPEQDITALDLIGEGLEEQDDCGNYLGVEHFLRPSPELLVALEAVRVAEEAIEACRVSQDVRNPNTILPPPPAPPGVGLDNSIEYSGTVETYLVAAIGPGGESAVVSIPVWQGQTMVLVARDEFTEGFRVYQRPAKGADYFHGPARVLVAQLQRKPGAHTMWTPGDPAPASLWFDRRKYPCWICPDPACGSHQHQMGAQAWAWDHGNPNPKKKPTCQWPKCGKEMVYRAEKLAVLLDLV